VPVPGRKSGLKVHLDKLDIAGCVYLPMSRSTAQWARVVSVLNKKGHPFSTRARCPTLRTFEVQGLAVALTANPVDECRSQCNINLEFLIYIPYIQYTTTYNI
jgi:hypothetical protein